MIAPTKEAGPRLWKSPQAPGRAPANMDGTSPQSGAARHIWEEDVQTYRTCTSVQQALKKQIISVFEPMHLDILNDNMVGYANISARDMLDHLFETYGNITAVDLEINFEHMHGLGILNNQLSPCSSKFSIAPTIMKQAAYSLGTPNKSMSGTQKYSQQVTS
jgi:hypothetical protein